MDAKENLIRGKIVRKDRYDSKIKTVEYKVGDSVLLRNENRSKLDPLYTGPYLITGVEEPNVIINYKGNNVKVHKNRTRLYVT